VDARINRYRPVRYSSPTLQFKELVSQLNPRSIHKPVWHAAEAAGATPPADASDPSTATLPKSHFAVFRHQSFILDTAEIPAATATTVKSYSQIFTQLISAEY
jgi:hypothetical protein